MNNSPNPNPTPSVTEELKRLEAEILRLVDALEFAHSSGFEWPVDPLPFGSIAHDLFIRRGNDPDRIAMKAAEPSLPRLTMEDEETIDEWFTGAGEKGASIPPSQRRAESDCPSGLGHIWRPHYFPHNADTPMTCERCGKAKP